MRNLKRIWFVICIQFCFVLEMASQVTLNTPEPNNVSKWSIYEVSFNSDETNYSNPFWDVEIIGTFTSPDNEILKVGGFYYDEDTWKLRFSPTKEGIWNYSIAFKTPTNTFEFTDNFECLPANSNHGFIQVSEENSYNFKYSDGTNVLINGINGHTPPVTAAFLGIPNTPSPADENMTKLMWQYLAQKNINTYRLQMFHQEWAPPVMEWNTFEGHANLLQNSGSLDKYDTENAKLIDKWFQDASDNGINIYPCLFTIHDDGNVYTFNQSPWSVENGGYYTSPTNMYSTTTDEGHDYVKKYVKYIVNRYGAFQNILAWEYNNEWGKYTSKDWINSIDEVITNNDPYNRAHAASYWAFDYAFDSELHDLPSNEIVDFHVYPWHGYDSEFTIDFMMNEDVSYFYDSYEKPILIGEYGSGDFDNNIPESEHYFDRIGYWTAFVSGGNALYWLRGDNSTTGIEYNIETLEWINSFGLITSNIVNVKNFTPKNAVISNIDTSNIRAYCFGAENEYLMYLHHYSNHDNNVINKSIQLSVPDSTWDISWYDPNSGSLISNENIESTNGVLNLSIPNFQVDIAMYLSNASNLGIEKINDISKYQVNLNPNPFSTEMSINFNLIKSEHVEIAIYSLNGRKINTIIDETLVAGQHTIKILSDKNINITTGMYLLNFNIESTNFSKKIIFKK
ncbi:DUF5060 domain-containing protein [Algibacter amylolyticus]|uniref:DUF5060 domain-containing protein n=1 Tax=Algibacter amylolyticus TaxID=1608400 RepID=A0A5M7AUY7_9FLAO|nr:DUF5060 domain-containing protein [Algibacter amylolyticus]KAA5821169.1 DUF5060 domain-containing protein [Algibacter amylolyticus]MBB5269814.1 hypothetical protein [Algibacter amylolyticus]TSJ72115.1 DUF5060 domain-containing protein [Algibacter amylolyticus]